MHNKKTDLILDRMNKKLEQQGKTQAELVAHLGLPKGTYTNWNLNRSRGFCEYIEEIASFLNVDIEWFITGRETNTPISPREKKLLEVYRELDTEKQDAVLQNMEWLVPHPSKRGDIGK